MVDINKAASFLHLPYRAGSGSYAMVEGAIGSAAVGAVDTLYLYPFRLQVPIAFTAGQVRVATGGAGSSAKGGIWANGGATLNRPLGAPLFVDNTGVATTSNNTDAALAFGAGTLGPGIYWFGSKFTGTLPTMIVVAVGNPSFGFFCGAPSPLAFSTGIQISATYASDMPTLADGASFTVVSTATIPVLALTT